MQLKLIMLGSLKATIFSSLLFGIWTDVFLNTLTCHAFFFLFIFQDEVDSQNPVLRDNPQLHEELKGWLKDQKVQEIFMQGKMRKMGVLLIKYLCFIIKLFFLCIKGLYLFFFAKILLNTFCRFQVPIHWMATACVYTDKTRPPSGLQASLHITTSLAETWSWWMIRYTPIHP